MVDKRFEIWKKHRIEQGLPRPKKGYAYAFKQDIARKGQLLPRGKWEGNVTRGDVIEIDYPTRTTRAEKRERMGKVYVKGTTFTRRGRVITKRGYWRKLPTRRARTFRF